MHLIFLVPVETKNGSEEKDSDFAPSPSDLESETDSQESEGESENEEEEGEEEEEEILTQKNVSDRAAEIKKSKGKRMKKRSETDSKQAPRKKPKNMRFVIDSQPMIEDEDDIANNGKKKIEIAKKIKKPVKGKDSLVEKKFEKKEKDDDKKIDATKLFNHCDFNLNQDTPENVIPTKVKINNNLMLTCRMIEANSNSINGLQCDYAALCFIRKTKNEKVYEMNVPLNTLDKIVEGCRLIRKANQKFFQSQKQIE